jgi:Zn-dependent alcohol dehydrogenase
MRGASAKPAHGARLRAALLPATSQRTASPIFEEKTLKVSFYGSARPRHDFPRLVSLYRAGKLKLDERSTS